MNRLVIKKSAFLLQNAIICLDIHAHILYITRLILHHYSFFCKIVFYGWGSSLTSTTIITKSTIDMNRIDIIIFQKCEFKVCIASGWNNTFIWKQKKAIIKLLSPSNLIPCDIHKWIFISEIYVSAGHVIESKTKKKLIRKRFDANVKLCCKKPFPTASIA